MKKWMKTCASMLLILGLAACGANGAVQSSISAPEPTAETVTAAPETTTFAETAEPEASASMAETDTPAAEGGKTLVVYFSASGNTEGAANAIAEAAGGDLFALEPVEPYTDDGLNWRDDDSRVVYEHDHEDARRLRWQRIQWKTGMNTTRCLSAIPSGGALRPGRWTGL